MGRILTVVIVVVLAASPARAQVATLISRNGGQQPADSHSYRPSLSADGRFVAFESWAGNLARGVDVTNNGVFVRDLVAGTTVLASPGIGAPPNDKSYMAAISGDGRVIAFWSRASNLVTGDTNGEEDLFTYDRVSAVVTRANVSTAGTPAEPADNGIHIVGDRPAVSADGRFVAFDSMAGNLVADDGNGVADVFVRDRQAGTTERVSLRSDGMEASLPSGGPAISDDGRFVAFWSQAALTPDDVDGVFDVYVYDRQMVTLERIGATTAANPPALSGDGRFVAFESDATDIVPGGNGNRHVYVHDRTLGGTMRVSVGAGAIQGDGDSGEPAISADGRWMAFRSTATNLVPGDGNGNDDVFLFDHARRHEADQRHRRRRRGGRLQPPAERQRRRLLRGVRIGRHQLRLRRQLRRGRPLPGCPRGRVPGRSGEALPRRVRLRVRLRNAGRRPGPRWRPGLRRRLPERCGEDEPRRVRLRRDRRRRGRGRYARLPRSPDRGGAEGPRSADTRNDEAVDAEGRRP